jgi:UTP--glucose-1-phosphate uridylyltransferase
MTTENHCMSVVIPAAGVGSRFLPLSRVVPKELLPLGEWPLIHHALLEAQRAGLTKAVIVISPHKRAIRAYFEGDPALEVALEAQGDLSAVQRLRAARELAIRLHLRFVEQETRGPGEAVVLGQRLLGDEVLGVLLPDDVVPSAGPWRALRALHQATGTGTLSVRSFPPTESGRFGIADCKRERGRLRVHGLIEKPTSAASRSAYRVFGRYIVTSAVLEALETQLRDRMTTTELQLTDGYVACLHRAGGVHAVEFEGDYFDCGTPAEYARSVGRYPNGSDQAVVAEQRCAVR